MINRVESRPTDQGPLSAQEIAALQAQMLNSRPPAETEVSLGRIEELQNSKEESEDESREK